MRKLCNAICSISLRNWLFFFIALALTCFIRIFLKIFSFKTTVKFLSWFESELRVEPRQYDIKLYQKLISWTYFFSPMLNCLSICTTYWWLMKRRGITTHMKFGIAKSNDKLIAHSWLEYRGRLLSYEPNPRRKYTTFERSILE